MQLKDKHTDYTPNAATETICETLKQSQDIISL